MEEMNNGLENVRANGGVEIMKASAGSGKTFSLAREYLRLLLADRESNSHRHILAVTFTNKATDEMKRRIVKELDILAVDPKSSPHHDFIMDECGFESDGELMKYARCKMTDILNDYGSFAVCTIDKFFQQTLRSFSREVGQMGEYRIELDRASLVSEAAARFLDSITEDDHDIRKWLADNSVEIMANGEGYHLEKNLKDFASRYMSGEFSAKVKAYGIDTETAFSQQNVVRLKEVCNKICRDYEKGVVTAATKARAVLDGLAFRPKVHVSNVVDKCMAFASGNDLDLSTPTWRNAVADVFFAFTKKDSKALGQADALAVQAALAELDAFAGERQAVYNTARILKDQIPLFRVVESLGNEFQNLLKEKNVLSIEDTNTILHDLIDNTYAPFIYEKTGVRYNHFLLDEFQDTSTVQWDNFLPLIRNSISEGNYNLVVGDVKQSIYRWRDAEWKILGSRIEKELASNAVTRLDGNWRSAKNIVDFNNSFFEVLSRKMDLNLEREFGSPGTQRLADIYADVKQKNCRKMTVPGSVEISFCDSNAIMDHAVESVIEAHDDRHFGWKDIAVLVRSNRDGVAVASMLIAEGIPVVSNESLRISSSSVVRTIVSRMFVMDDPNDEVNTFYAGDFEAPMAGGYRSLEELVDHLASGIEDRDVVSRETTYLLAFKDLVRDYVRQNGNSLHGFLSYWKEKGVAMSISSPEGSEAVTVITIHKAKGLDFPFVIVPFPKTPKYISPDSKSLEPLDVDSDSEFGNVERSLYDLRLKDGLKKTLFLENFRREKEMLYLDDINTWYVAFTRASEALHVISPVPAADILNCPVPDGGVDAQWPGFTAIHAALYLYVQFSGLFTTVQEDLILPDENVADETAADEEGDAECAADGEAEEKVPCCERYLYGTVSDKMAEKGEEKPLVAHLDYNCDGIECSARGRLRISSEADGFFAEEGEASSRESRKMRGIVLHGIMERVGEISDVPSSVQRAKMDGLLGEEDVARTTEMLTAAVSSVSGRGWFGPDVKALDERDIVSSKGNVFRPDRVVVKPSGVEIIDYKFGEHNDGYLDKVRIYAALYRGLGFRNVSAHVWYVETGVIEDA